MSFNYGAKIAAKNWWHAHRLSVKVKEPQPGVAKARVIFAGLSHSGFRRGGKVTAKEYLPPFCDVLRKHGYQTFFATSLLGLKLRLRQDIPTVIVMIYREVGFIPEQDGLSDVLQKAQVVYNHPDMGRIIANKSAANDFLSNRGVPMPSLESVGEAEGAVFSNAETDTGAEVYVLEAGDALDPARYNTRFIDTRRTHNDETYHVSVRLMHK
jgi:hypothetical protein